MAIEVGDLAPDFALPNQDRETVRLSEEVKEHPVVLAFFPAAFSRVCTKEMCTFRDSNQELRRLAARVLGISVDSFFALKAWAKQENLDFPLLSDFNKTVIRQYGVWKDDLYGLEGVAKRATFLIDRNRVVRYREVLDDVTQEPDYQKLKQAIAELK